MRRVALVVALVAALVVPLAGGVAPAPAAAAPGPVVGVAATPTGAGHWTTTTSGAVVAAGDAKHLGDMSGVRLARPIVGIAATPTGRGYFLVAGDGGIFTFGDAVFRGSTGAIRLNRPIVGMASTPTGRGYWLVASDGGVFTFGDASFFGSTGAIRLNQPITGMTRTKSGRGYWMVARDGGIFRFGDAAFFGSAGAMRLPSPVVGMATTATGGGYWLATAAGTVLPFGDAAHLGDAPAPIVAMTGSSGYRLAGADGSVTSFAPGKAPVTSASAGARDPFLWPFASTSPWNTPIGSGAKHEGADGARTKSLTSTATSAWVNAGQYSHPIFKASASDPLVTLSRPGMPTVSLRMPAAARASAGTDGHLHVVDPTGRWVDESWKTGGAFPNLTTGYHVRTDLYGPGVGQRGVRAYGGSAIGGLIRKWELDAGSIRHVLALAITGDQLQRGPVWPATNEDGNAASSYRGAVPMGTLASIPGSVDLTRLGLSREGLALATALQDFGAYVVDRAGCACLVADPSLEGTPALANLRRDFAKVRGLLRVVTNNGPSSVGGGGTPRAPLAPPLR